MMRPQTVFAPAHFCSDSMLKTAIVFLGVLGLLSSTLYVVSSLGIPKMERCIHDYETNHADVSCLSLQRSEWLLGLYQDIQQINFPILCLVGAGLLCSVGVLIARTCCIVQPDRTTFTHYGAIAGP